MAMIYVKAKEGRKLFYEGRIIPTDKFVAVTDDPYISRLVHHWGDLEVQGGTGTPVKAPSARLKPPPPQPVRTTTTAAPNTPAPGTGAPKPN